MSKTIFDLIKNHLGQPEQKFGQGGSLESRYTEILEESIRAVVANLATSDFIADFTPTLVYEPQDTGNPYRGKGSYYVYSRPDNLVGFSSISPQDPRGAKYRYSNAEIIVGLKDEQNYIIDSVANPLYRGFFSISNIDRWHPNSRMVLSLYMSWVLCPSVNQDDSKRSMLNQEYSNSLMERRVQDNFENPLHLNKVESILSDTVASAGYLNSPSGYPF